MYSDMHINVSLVPFLAFAPHLNGDDEDSQRIFPEDKKNQQQQQQKQVQLEDVGSSKSRQKKPKKAHSLVRKLSLSKFKTLPEPETRHTPEGGDSSRSLSQSSQESTSRLDSSPTLTPRKESTVQEKWSTCSLPASTQNKSTVNESEDARKQQREGSGSGGKKGEEQPVQQKSEKLIEKPVSTITVVQRKSPSLTIKISNLQERTLKLQQYGETNSKQNQKTSSIDGKILSKKKLKQKFVILQMCQFL